MSIRTVKDLIEELQRYPGHMRVGLDYANSWGSFLTDFVKLEIQEAAYNKYYEFKNSKNENSEDFVHVLVIS